MKMGLPLSAGTRRKALVQPQPGLLGVLAKHKHKLQNGPQPAQTAHGDIVLDTPEMLLEAWKCFYLKRDLKDCSCFLWKGNS